MRYAGSIEPDGSAEIFAWSQKAASEAAVEHATSADYTLRGSFDATAGQAVRTDVRPCRASFRKQ